MKKAILLPIAAGLLFWGGALLAGEGASYQIVVNPENPTSRLERDRVSKMFLKKIARWDHDVTVLPVDLIPRSPVREKFSKEIHGKSVGTIKNYWQQQIFSGRNAPPPEKTSDSDVIEYVRVNAGAIGYVSGEADVEGVKAVEITE